MTGAAEPSAVDAGPAPAGLVDEVEQVAIDPAPSGAAGGGGTDEDGATALDAGPPDDVLVDEIEATLLAVDDARDGTPPGAPTTDPAGGASDQVDAADAGGPPPALTADVEALDDD